jgi:hypothetical protein
MSNSYRKGCFIMARLGFDYLERIRKAGFSDTEILEALISAMSETEVVENFESIISAFNIVNKEVTADSQELNLTKYQIGSLARELFSEPEFEACWFDNADPQALINLITKAVQKKYPKYSNIEKAVNSVFEFLTDLLGAK